MKKIMEKAAGVTICFLLALPAWLLGRAIPIVGGPVFGILFGILLAGIKRPAIFNEGIRFTSKKVLQYSIVLLGFEMNLFHVIRVGGQSLAVLFFTLAAAFLTAYFVCKALHADKNPAILIGVGTSICGGSAIAATAPVIKAKDDEIAHAVSTIFLFNVIAVFLFPALGHLMGLSDHGFGMWAGTAINDTSSVVAAGVAWSNAAGNNTALAIATIVKLTRTLMIVPVTLALAVYMTKKNAATESGKSEFKLVKIFPWFVLGFVLTAIVNTFIPLPQGLPETLVMLGKFMIIMAMCAIGLGTNLKKLIQNGFKPIFLGLCCWFMVAAVSLAVQNLFGML